MSANVLVNQSATQYGAVTPSDSTDLSFKRLYVGGAGNVIVKPAIDAAAVTFSNVPAGACLEVSGVRVMAATTATSMVWMSW